MDIQKEVDLLREKAEIMEQRAVLLMDSAREVKEHAARLISKTGAVSTEPVAQPGLSRCVARRRNRISN